MRTRSLVCAVAILGGLGFGGCRDGASPTEASGGSTLNGSWIGSITYYDSPACAPRESVALVLSQERRVVGGRFQTECQGLLELRGELNGDFVSGILYRVRDNSTIGRISGTASPTSIRITTWGSQARNDTGPRVRSAVNTIDLTR
jgi:hypothetical protein